MKTSITRWMWNLTHFAEGKNYPACADQAADRFAVGPTGGSIELAFLGGGGQPRSTGGCGLRTRLRRIQVPYVLALNPAHDGRAYQRRGGLGHRGGP